MRFPSARPLLTALLVFVAFVAHAAELAPPPTHADVPYGPAARNVLDFWAAELGFDARIERTMSRVVARWMETPGMTGFPA